MLPDAVVDFLLEAENSGTTGLSTDPEPFEGALVGPDELAVAVLEEKLLGVGD